MRLLIALGLLDDAEARVVAGVARVLAIVVAGAGALLAVFTVLVLLGPHRVVVVVLVVAVNRRQRAEVRRVARLVGPSGLRPLPIHVWCRELIASGKASRETVAAAECERAYWDAVLPTLPVLGAAGARTNTPTEEP